MGNNGGITFLVGDIIYVMRHFILPWSVRRGGREMVEGGGLVGLDDRSNIDQPSPDGIGIGTGAVSVKSAQAMLSSVFTQSAMPFQRRMSLSAESC